MSNTVKGVALLSVLILLSTGASGLDADEPTPTELSKLTVKETTPSDYVAPDASTGTRTDTPIMETPLDVQVVTQQVLIDQQVIRIDQALKNVSGVAFTGGGDESFGNAFDAVVVRGFQTDSHLRDGIRIDSFGGDTELFTQQLANVDSIEVLKGPAAILYGAVEPGGVVNVVTKKPQDTPAYSVQQQFGSYGLYRTTVDATGPLDREQRLLYRFDGSYDTSGSIVDLGFSRNLFLAPSLKLRLGEEAQITVEYEHKDSSFNGNYAIFPLVQSSTGEFVPLFNDPQLNFGEGSTMRERADLGAVDWSLSFAPGWSARQEILANIVHATGPQVTSDGIGPLDPDNPASPPAVYRDQFPFDNQDDTYASFVDITGHLTTGGLAQTLLLGGDWYRFISRYVLSYTNPTYAPDASVDSVISLFNPVHPGTPFGPPQPYYAGNGPTDTWGVHLQDQVAFHDELFALLGVRYQHVFEANESGETLSTLTSTPLNGSATTPRFGLLWRPQRWLSLYANYAKNWGPSNGYPLASGGLVPPTGAHQKEVGFKLDFLDSRITSTVAVYDLTKTNIPTPDPVNPAVYLITGQVRSRGLEVDLQGEIYPGLNVIANFADIDAQIISSDDPSNPPGTQWQETPRLIGNVWATYEPTPGSDRGFKVGFGVNAQGRQPALNFTGTIASQTSDDTYIGGYATLNAMAAYHVKLNGYKLTAQLNVSNLLDQRYFSYISLTNPGPGSTYTYEGAVYSFDRRLYGDPRIFMGSLSLEF